LSRCLFCAAIGRQDIKSSTSFRSLAKIILLFFDGHYFRCMIPEEDISQRWQQLEEYIMQKTGQYTGIDDILLYIGIQESGMPPKPFTEREKTELILMATSTVLVPARYYELFWVEDTGWPHYKQLQRLPPMPKDQLDNFLKPWIIRYADKNRMV